MKIEDIDEHWSEMMKLAESVDIICNDPYGDPLPGAAGELAKLVLDLDKHLRAGGSLPSKWKYSPANWKSHANGW